MKNFIESLTASNSPAVFLTIGAMFFIVFMKEYLNFMLKMRAMRRKGHSLGEAGGEAGDGASRGADGAPLIDAEVLSTAKPPQIVSFNFALLERYYEQHLIEYKLMSRASLAIASFGFIVITVGVFLAFAGQTSVGVLTSIAGVVAEAASVLFFNQNKVIMNQVLEYHKKLVSTQYLLTAVSLAQQLPGGTGEAQVTRIIGNLLFLSNVLHGAGSGHLFREAADGAGGRGLEQPPSRLSEA